MNVDPVSTELKDLFQLIFDTEGETTFELQFTCDELAYKVIFHVKSESTPAYSVFTLYLVPKTEAFKNSCITITESDYEDTLSSFIRANSPEQGCFTPVLTLRDNIKPTDVLQVLKSKLILLFPRQKPITLEDQATIKNVVISAFKILHRQPALYEKYGYKSEILNALRTDLEHAIINDLKYDVLVGTKIPVKQALETIVKRPIGNDEKVLDVYSQITFEQESDFNTESLQKGGKNKGQFDSRFMLSIKILESLSLKYHKFNWNTFTLDNESQQWEEWNSRLKFTSVTVIHPENPLLNINTNVFKGGRRKKTCKRRRPKRLTRRLSTRSA